MPHCVEIENNPTLSIVKITKSLGSSQTSVQEYLINIGKVWRQNKWIPHELS